MACFSRTLVFFSFLLCFSSSSSSAFAATPKALVLPVTKDGGTLQYITHVHQGRPSSLVDLVVDLGGRFSWLVCAKPSYVSTSGRPVHCGSPGCPNFSFSCDCDSRERPCNIKDTCSVLPDNPLRKLGTSGTIFEDGLSLESTDGEVANVPVFHFACTSKLLLKGLKKGVAGMAGLGRSDAGMPAQLFAAFGLRRKFALCVSSSTERDGVLFFGDGPYTLLPNADASRNLIYTPLVRNPVSTAGSSVEGEPSFEYFVGVTGIKLDGKAVPVNSTFLAINKNGVGGTKISTVTPYTTLQTSIYKAVAEAFARGIAEGSRVAPVKPFKYCFNSKKIRSTRAGPAVPDIDLILQSESVFWRILGANSMVQVSDDVICLGFVDGGESPTTSIVIGGHQLEDNLLQFDLAASKLGFSSSLLLRQTTCANYNFASKA